MKIPTRYSKQLQKLAEASCTDWIETVRLIGMNPAVFFEDSDWSGVDFSMSNMRTVSFRGARIDNAIFRAGDLSESQRRLALSAKNIVEVPIAEDRQSLEMDRALQQNFSALNSVLHDSDVFIMAAEVGARMLNILAENGAGFECHTIDQVKMAFNAGAAVPRIFFGAPSARDADITRAYVLGVRHFAIDNHEQVEMLSKFGFASDIYVFFPLQKASIYSTEHRRELLELAADVLTYSYQLGMNAAGVSLRVHSSEINNDIWDEAVAEAKWIFRRMAAWGITLSMIRVGGEFGASQIQKPMFIRLYGRMIVGLLKRHFGNQLPESSIEVPSR